MNNRIACSLMAVFLFAMYVAPAVALEEFPARQVLAEINLARTEPLKFAGFLRELRSSFQGEFYRIPGAIDPTEINEGVAAVDEAIQFLSRQKPLPPLAWSAGLAAAGAELVLEQGTSGVTGHGGVRNSGMQERIQRHGTWKGRIGENIVYGLTDSRSMVMKLIIDDGVPGRGHRKNQFNPVFESAGIACGPHPLYGGMCVIDFSGRFREVNTQRKTPNISKKRK